MFSLKNPKFIVLALIAALGVGGGIWFVRAHSTPQKQSAAVVAVIPHEPSSSAPDSDGDGLKDWEEALWKTDPHNPDTDGDGTPDGEEIKAGRDPLRKGADTMSAPAAPQSPAPEEPKTLTDRLGHDFSAIYLYGKNNGVDIQTMTGQVVSSFTKTLSEEQNPSANTPSVKPVIRVADSAENQIAYSKALAKIFDEEFKKAGLEKNEMDLLLGLLNSASGELDPAGFKQFERYANAYKNAASRMETVSVPSYYANNHALLIQSFLRLSVIDMTLAAFPDDPAQHIQAIADYRSESGRAQLALGALNKLPAFAL